MSREVSLEGLTPKDWVEIKKLAIQIYNSGQHQRDQLKCGIHAFVLWLVTNDCDLVSEDPPDAQDLH